jgi:hypothetical protein
MLRPRPESRHDMRKVTNHGRSGLTNLPPALPDEISEWATLRRTTPERAAIKLLRIGLHATSEKVKGRSVMHSVC